MNTTEEKLRAAVRVLKGVPDDKFDMTVWHADRYHPTTSCGTVACVAGWCAMDPEFNCHGFDLDYGYAYRDGPTILMPKYKGLTGIAAVSCFFDILKSEANDLFMEDGYDLDDGVSHVTRQMAIDALEAFIADHAVGAKS